MTVPLIVRRQPGMTTISRLALDSEPLCRRRLLISLLNAAKKQRTDFLAPQSQPDIQQEYHPITANFG
jgi:hypothetical protein